MRPSAHQSVCLYTMFVVCSDNNACESTAAAGRGKWDLWPWPSVALLLEPWGSQLCFHMLTYTLLHWKKNQTDRLDSHCYIRWVMTRAQLTLFSFYSWHFQYVMCVLLVKNFVATLLVGEFEWLLRCAASCRKLPADQWQCSSGHLQSSASVSTHHCPTLRSFNPRKATLPAQDKIQHEPNIKCAAKPKPWSEIGLLAAYES